MAAGQSIEAQMRESAARLVQVTDSPRLDARLLAMCAFELDAAGLIRDGDRVPAAHQTLTLQNLVARRLNGEPVAYITGSREFWSLELHVNSAVLIPRPESELLVETALEYLAPDNVGTALDLGTGSGALALAIARDRPQVNVTAVDLCVDALAVAKDNARNNNVTNVSFVRSRWFDSVTGWFNVIVANPPYIAENDPHLKKGDVAFEPRQALVSGSEGLDDLALIIHAAPAYLVENGTLAVEHGFDQGAAVVQLFAAAGFAGVETRRDLAGHQRVTLGRISTDS